MTHNRQPIEDQGPGPGWFALTLGGLIAGAFSMVLMGWEAFCYRDYGVISYPFVHFLRDSIRAGELPLWNPFSNCGAPFLAQWGPMVLYPFSLIYILLPLPWSLGVFCLAHLFLGGLGMYFLARRWAGNRLAASVAGIAFAFGGVSQSCLMWPNYTVALGWMPWVVWWVERGWREGGRTLLLAAILGSLQMLSGVPEVILLTWLLLAAIWLGQLWIRACDRRKGCLRFAGMIALVAGLSAVQVLPFFDLLAHSQRGSDFATTKWAMPAWGWANLLVPMFHYFMTPQRTFFQAGQEFMTSYYPGAGVLALAILAVWRIRQRRVWLLAAVVLATLTLALGDHGPLYPWLKHAIPFLGLARYPIKFVILAAFVIPLLAAFGISALKTFPTRWRMKEWRPVWLVGLILIGLMAVVAWVAFQHPLPYDQPRLTQANAQWRAAALVLTLALGVGCVLTETVSLQWVLQIGLLLVVGIDLLTQIPRINPTISPIAFTPGMVREVLAFNPPVGPGVGRVMISPAAEELLNYSGEPDLQKQFLGRRRALWSNLNLLDNMPKVNGSSTLQLREQAEVQSLLYGPTGTNATGLIDFLNVSQMTSPKSAIEWTPRAHFLPLISVGSKPVFASGAATLRALADPSFDPRQIVYLPKKAEDSITADAAPDARIITSRFASQRVEFEMQASAPAVVTVAQSYYHWWEARVDGTPVKLWQANHAFQALEVPAGRHQVTLVYHDRLFTCGAVVSALTLLGCVAVTIWGAARRRKTAPSHFK